MDFAPDATRVCGINVMFVKRRAYLKPVFHQHARALEPEAIFLATVRAQVRSVAHRNAHPHNLIVAWLIHREVHQVRDPKALVKLPTDIAAFVCMASTRAGQFAPRKAREPHCSPHRVRTVNDARQRAARLRKLQNIPRRFEIERNALHASVRQVRQQHPFSNALHTRAMQPQPLHGTARSLHPSFSASHPPLWREHYQLQARTKLSAHDKTSLSKIPHMSSQDYKRWRATLQRHFM
mmetsp:Transcript_10086/g.26941  ORF Transcript_10086/g.26941 Transcript_10086/m.26941 type:complete len:237 (-) Transcript_10086:780-1490(-)